jgi:hypothetical protein
MASLSAASPSSAERAFEPHEVLLSIAFSTGVIVSFFMLLVVAGESMARVTPAPEQPPAAIPIKVNPVLDDLPLLKLGGKRVRPKLPEMWKKNPPVKRFEDSSAPSPKAAKTPEALPTSKLAKPDAEAPPPDAEVAKKVDQVLLEAGPPDAAPTVEGEGSPDGVKEGTEADPLKARAMSAYTAKLLAFLNSRFVPPSAQETGLPCEEAKKLLASASVSVGGERMITGATMSKPSGNAAFDARLQSTLANLVGQQLPPPPPLYPDILPPVLSPRYSGSSTQCE